MAQRRTSIPKQRGSSRSLALTCAGLAFICLLPLLWAAPPAWWSKPGVLNTNPPDDYAAANIGQLKHFASKARIELDAHLPGQAGVAVNNLVNGWSAAVPPGTTRDDYAGVTLGQLKSVAKPFYQRLIAVGYTTGYPWTNSLNPPDDYAIANLGQLKQVFAFDLASVDTMHDANHSGIPDWWESYYGLSGVDPQTDSDDDGLTNLQEYLQGSNPLDFFNSLPPVLALLSGNNQGDFPGLPLAKPLAARLTNQIGTPQPGVNVVFSIHSGGGQLTPTNGGLTDTNGIARASLQLPMPVGTTVLVKASYSGQEVTFIATVGDITQSPEAPGRPEITSEHGTTTAFIEWEDRSNNETAFYVERALNGENWTRTATLPANTTSFTDTTVLADEIYFYRIVAHNPAP